MIGLAEHEELLRERAEQLDPKRGVAAVEHVEGLLEQLHEDVVDEPLLGPPRSKAGTAEPESRGGEPDRVPELSGEVRGFQEARAGVLDLTRAPCCVSNRTEQVVPPRDVTRC